METTTKTKKATLATIKSFIKNNPTGLFVNIKSQFDGMTDGTEQRHEGFKPSHSTTEHIEHTLGVTGAWFVGSSRDYITPYNENGFFGYSISNSCGRFVIAIKNTNSGEI